MATLYSISESVRALIEGSDVASKPKFTMQEVKIAAIQVINSTIKTQHLTEEMSGGEAIPDGTVLAEYDNVAVEIYKNVSRATLPAMPVKMPLNIGIFHVGKTDDIIEGFIPYEVGQLQMLGEEAIISDVLGQIAYEPRGKYLIFNKDITAGDDDTAINEVYMLLAVKNLSLYTDWEMLPISASMESTVIQQTFEWLMGQQATNKKVDVINKQEGNK
jgi:ribosomal protein L20A (L18A)